MSNRLTKDDLHFLVAKMEHHHKSLERSGEYGAGEDDNLNGKVQDQEMSIPTPVSVNAKGNMTEEEYKACSTLMAVCQNMVQKNLIKAAKAANQSEADALKNMDAWVKAFVIFPLPIFNFKDTQSDVYHKSDFSIKADPNIVEKVVNIKGVDDLKDAVLAALKSSGGNLASYSEQDKNFNYFGVITAYNKNDISNRLIKFQMHMKSTKVDSLCVHYTNTTLDTTYDTYQFTADKIMMIKLQEKMGGQLVDYIADKLLGFLEDFYSTQLAEYSDEIGKILKRTT